MLVQRYNFSEQKTRIWQKKLERTFSTRYLFDFQIVISLKSLKQTLLFNIKNGKACILEK